MMMAKGWAFRSGEAAFLWAALAVASCGPAFAQAVGPLVDAGTLAITLGGASQTAFAASTSSNRKALYIENPCTTTSQGIGSTESLFVNFATAAGGTNGSIELAACGSIVMSGGYVSQQQVNVEAATTGHLFVAKQTQ